ncbi:MAG: PDZ domain-containing protein [Pyrinomonadaceae bacterium]|nr:PDZ domain-containing protein [Pyrinomonadaceae bacterium]
MESENQQFDMRTGDDAAAGTDRIDCPSCRAVMVRGMRFCRLCGYRLGEGVAEYAETRRFAGVTPPASRPTASADASTPTAGQTGWAGVQSPLMSPIAPLAPLNTTSFQGATSARFSCAKSGMSWVFWLVIAIAIMAATGGAIFKPISRLGGSGNAAASAPRSFFREDNFEDVDDGGVMISAVEILSPAAQAGLIGGDIVKSFDGQPVTDEDGMRELLARTPAGKTVEVVYVRDGETKQTMLTTISQRDYKNIDFDDRPEGEGFLGIEAGDLERVAVPNTEIHGVRLGDVYRNRPGYLAGLREGDIVIEFNEHLIRTEKEFLLRIDEALPDSIIKAVVMRGGERLEIPVKMGKD